MKSTSQFTIVMLLVIIAAFVVKNVFLYFQNVGAAAFRIYQSVCHVPAYDD